MTLATALAILACYRLAELVAYDDGPWKVLDYVRKNVMPPVLRKLLTCPYCLGMWWAILLGSFLVWYYDISRWLAPLYILSIAGGQSFLEAWSLRSAERGPE